MTAHLSNDWLLFDAPVSDRVAREDLWRLLGLNATLSGFSKFVLTPRRSFHLRADVPLSEEDDNMVSEEIVSQEALDAKLAAHLGEICSSLKAAYGLFRGEDLARCSSALTGDRGEHQAEDLRRTCTETGWPFIERAAGKMMIELEAQDSFHQAVVEQSSAGIRLSVEIARFDDFESISRQAVSALLLTTGAQVRLARPSVDEQAVGRFEVMFATLPVVSELRHALSSLSIACAMCGREALALQDENIARQYLAYTESPTNFSLSIGL